MNNVYTCPYCLRQYTVTKAGAYICDCGHEYHCTDGSNIIENYAAAVPVFLDSSSRSLNRELFYNRTRSITHVNRNECIFSKSSLICGILGLLFFGLFSLPAFILGIMGIITVLNPNNHVKGIHKSLAGILLALIGFVSWGLIALMYLEL